MHIPKTFFPILAGLVFPALLPAADSQESPIVVPPLVQPATHESLPGKFIWGDLFAAYPLQAAKFYSQVLGWNLRRFENGDQAYWMMFNGDRPVAGVVRHAPEETRPDALKARWVGYISVPDLAGAVEKVKAEGGQVLVEPRSVPDRGTLAIVTDSQGTIVGLMNSSSGDPADREAETGGWIWVQLFSTQPRESKSFYESVFGYEVTDDPRTERDDDYLLVSQGYSRAGLVPLEAPPGTRGGWMGFVRVADIEATLRTARELGSKVLLAPDTGDPAADKMAVLTDTYGGVFGLFEFGE